MRVKITQGKALHLFKHTLAEIVHKALSDYCHGASVQEGRHPTDSVY